MQIQKTFIKDGYKKLERKRQQTLYVTNCKKSRHFYRVAYMSIIVSIKSQKPSKNNAINFTKKKLKCIIAWYVKYCLTTKN